MAFHKRLIAMSTIQQCNLQRSRIKKKNQTINSRNCMHIVVLLSTYVIVFANN